MIIQAIKDIMHKIIRKNELSSLMIGLIDDHKDVIDEYIIRLKNFLNKDHKFDVWSPKKYIILMQYMKEEFGDIWENQLNEILLKLYNLYNIPKKRNNLFLVFLLYFYINRKSIIKEKIVFKIIYLYYLIIIYRNRLPYELRYKLINIDKLHFKSIYDIVSNKVVLAFLDLWKFLVRNKWYIGSFLFMLVFWLWVMFIPNMFKADIMWGFDMNRIFMDTILFWSPDDSFMKETTWNGSSIMYFLVLTMIIMFIQVFKDIVRDSIIYDVINFIVSWIKQCFRLVFYLYIYFVNLFTTKSIHYFVLGILKFNINMSYILLFLFMVFYIFIHFFIVSLYMLFFVYLFDLKMVSEHFMLINLFVSLILIVFNFVKDTDNFEQFVVWIDGFLKYVQENSTQKS